MSESGERLGKFIERDRKRAEKLVVKKGKLIVNPMARFNLGLDGQNQNWQPSVESGLDPNLEPVLTDELIQELKSPEKIADPETGQRFNVIKANWNRLGQEPTLVYLPPYNNAIGEGATFFRIQELARQIGRSTLAIDYPQVGESDDLTKEQKQDLASEEGYGTIAEAQLRVMKQLGIEEIDLVGQSMGAWTVSAIAERAEKYGIKVKNLIVIDSPGIEDAKVGKLSKAEIAEVKYLDLYQSTPYDHEMRIAGGQHFTSLRKKLSFTRWALSSLRKDPDGVYKKAMARGYLTAVLRRSLQSNPDLRIKVVNGSLSRISPKEFNLKMVKELQSEFPGRISQAIFSGEPHYVMESAGRLAAMTNHVLTRSFF